MVVETTPDGDHIVMGEAANQEALASDPRGPVRAAQTARLFYRRLVEMFPDSPLRRKRRGARPTSCGRFKRPMCRRDPPHMKKMPICANSSTMTR